MSDQQKVVGDWTLATEDTILALRNWLSQLQAWKAQGHADETDLGVFHLSRSTVKRPEGVGDNVLNCWPGELVQLER